MSIAAGKDGVTSVARLQVRPHVQPPTMFARALIHLIRLYQQIVSPYLGRACRFEPSCSRYAVACLESHGAARGSLLSVRRLCKCHPFHPGGLDLPPPQKLAPGPQ